MTKQELDIFENMVCFNKLKYGILQEMSKIEKTVEDKYDKVVIREYLKEELGLSEYRLRKICGNVKDFYDYDEWIQSAYDKITEYLADNEERKVNEYLDGVKNLYGYEELRCAGVFSNGEGIYEKVG